MRKLDPQFQAILPFCQSKSRGSGGMGAVLLANAFGVPSQELGTTLRSSLQRFLVAAEPLCILGGESMVSPADRPNWNQPSPAGPIPAVSTAARRRDRARQYS